MSESGIQSKYHYRAKVGALSRSRSHDDPELIASQRGLRAAMLAEHIRRVVDEAPPLPESMRAELAALLGGGSE